MESAAEVCRLDLKTDPETIRRQARWAGIRPGMRVADMGCGSGKTSYWLNRLVQPAGKVVGVDNAPQRIQYAESHYRHEGLSFVLDDIRENLKTLGLFDFIWVRFVLEYYRSTAFEIVKSLSRLLNPGGILCLIDLDYNCLSHYGIPERLEKAIVAIKDRVEQTFDFDAYAGRKLYAYLYDLEFQAIDVLMEPHHLIFGALTPVEIFNWTQKVTVGAKLSGYAFDEYPGGYPAFYEEFKNAFSHPRRFTYTPVIVCKGEKALT